MTAVTVASPRVRQDAGLDVCRLAEQVSAALMERVPVVVEVNGYGRGWYVTAVDWGRELFEVTRGKASISVAWSAVRAGE